jgi:hypothetical protein
MEREELLDLQRTTLQQLHAEYEDVPMTDPDDESDAAPEPDEDYDEEPDAGVPYRPMVMPPQRLHNNVPITYGMIPPHLCPPPPPPPPSPPPPPPPRVPSPVPLERPNTEDFNAQVDAELARIWEGQEVDLTPPKSDKEAFYEFLAVCGNYYRKVMNEVWYCDVYGNSLWKKDPDNIGNLIASMPDEEQQKLGK